MASNKNVDTYFIDGTALTSEVGGVIGVFADHARLTQTDSKQKRKATNEVYLNLSRDKKPIKGKKRNSTSV